MNKSKVTWLLSFLIFFLCKALGSVSWRVYVHWIHFLWLDWRTLTVSPTIRIEFWHVWAFNYRYFWLKILMHAAFLRRFDNRQLLCLALSWIGFVLVFILLYLCLERLSRNVHLFVELFFSLHLANIIIVVFGWENMLFYHIDLLIFLQRICGLVKLSQCIVCEDRNHSHFLYHS